MSMDKEPPPLPVPKAPPAPKPPPPDRTLNTINGILNGLEALGRFKKWLDTPDPPKPPKAPPVKKDYMAVPPFDIQEIPGAMRKEHMPVGAKLMERWFNGRLNYSPDGSEVNQDGKPFAPDMYETGAVTLDWVLKFGRAKEACDYLVNIAIRSPEAIDALGNMLVPYKGMSGLYTDHIVKKDPRELHRLFQFASVRVGGTLADSVALQLRTQTQNFNRPDDLTGALGSFNLYAAVGHVRFSANFVNGERMSDTRIAELTGIWVYVKDNYTFSDASNAAQYLGHWSNGGVIVPVHGAMSASYVQSPVTIGSPTSKGNVHYPIHNSDFQQWAQKHKRGGDFVVYTDHRFVPINPPIQLYLRGDVAGEQVAGSEGTPGNNQAQNKQFKAVVRVLGLDKYQARQLHEEISKQGLGYHEMLQRGQDMFGDGND